MIEILPDIWICKYKDLKTINYNNFEIINCYSDLSFLTNELNRINYELVKLYKYINSKIAIIDKCVKENKQIIITCKTCKQLSPLVCAAYMIKYGQMEIIEVLKCLKSKKEDIFEPEIMFSNILDKIYVDNSK